MGIYLHHVNFYESADAPTPPSNHTPLVDGAWQFQATNHAAVRRTLFLITEIKLVFHNTVLYHVIKERIIIDVFSCLKSYAFFVQPTSYVHAFV